MNNSDVFKHLTKQANMMKSIVEQQKEVRKSLEPAITRLKNQNSKTNDAILKQINSIIYPYLTKRIDFSNPINEYIKMNKEYRNAIESLSTNLSNSIENSISINEVKNEYNDLLASLNTFESTTITDRERDNLTSSVDFIEESFKDTFQVPKTKDNYVDTQEKREDSQGKDTGYDSQYTFSEFTQNIKDLLTSPKWQSEKLAEAIVSEFYGLLFQLVSAVINGSLDSLTFFIVIRILLSFFKINKSK